MQETPACDPSDAAKGKARPALRCALIFLAAGRSQRFGDDDKLEALLGGKPLALVTADRLEGMVWAQKIALVHSALLASPLRQRGFTLLIPAPNAGMGDNLSLAVAAVKDADAVLIVLADMPFIDRALIERLKAAIDTDREISIAVSETEGIVSPPALFSRKHFNTLRTLSGDRGAFGLISRHSTEVTRIAVPHPGLFDIDTRDALKIANTLITAPDHPAGA
ncbi:MAG: NTP transferase domain-containing protein [Asticcacaulis sp.]